MSTPKSITYIILVMSKLARAKYIGLTLVFLLLTLNFARNTSDVLKNSGRLENLKKRVQTLEEKRNTLKSDIRYGKTDEFVEEKARNELGLLKPGEKLYLMPEDPLQSTRAKKDSSRIDPTLEIEENPWFKVKAQDGRENFREWVRLFLAQ